MKQIAISLCMLILVLTACSSKETAEQTEERNPETDFQTEYCALVQNAHPMVEVEDGYYMLVGSFLYYVDKETMEYTPVCNKPNCLHQKEMDSMKVGKCNAFVQNDTYICLNYYKGYLYVASIEVVWNDEHAEQKCVMNRIPLDGGERKVVHQFENPVEMAIVHRGYIYYSSAYAMIGSQAAGVYRIPIEGGEEETLYTSDSNKNQLTHLRVIENELVFTEYGEYGDDEYDCLWRYDLKEGKLQKVVFDDGINLCCAGTAKDRIYYFCQKEGTGKDTTMSTNLDWSDPREENFVAHQQDEDYYYKTTWEGHVQTVYDWDTEEEVTKFNQLIGAGAFMVGKERLFWICGNDDGGIVVSYIERKDIPKGDSAVKVIMELSSDEVDPAIVTIRE